MRDLRNRIFRKQRASTCIPHPRAASRKGCCGGAAQKAGWGGRSPGHSALPMSAFHSQTLRAGGTPAANWLWCFGGEWRREAASGGACPPMTWLSERLTQEELCAAGCQQHYKQQGPRRDCLLQLRRLPSSKTSGTGSTRATLLSSESDDKVCSHRAVGMVRRWAAPVLAARRQTQTGPPAHTGWSMLCDQHLRSDFHSQNL